MKYYKLRFKVDQRRHFLSCCYLNDDGHWYVHFLFIGILPI